MVGHMTLNHVIGVRAPARQPMYFLYLLLCKDGSVYTGITTDVKRRFEEHRQGIGSRYTRARGAKEIIYTEKFNTRSDVLKREAEIKRWNRQKKMSLIKTRRQSASEEVLRSEDRM